MTRPDDTDGPTDSREEIMRATYRALSAHGTAGLTMQAIADETSLSKGALHYHYDTKDELLVTFLERLMDRFRDGLELRDSAPADQLDTLIETLLYGPDNHEAFHTAMLELRAAAPYDEAYRRQIRRNDAELRSIVEDVVERGVERGDFRDVDAAVTSEYVLSTVRGALIRYVVLDRERAIGVAAEELRRYVDARLLASAAADAPDAENGGAERLTR